MNLLQRQRNEKVFPEAGRHGEGCQAPSVERLGRCRWHGKATVEELQAQKRGCSSALGGSSGVQGPWPSPEEEVWGQVPHRPRTTLNCAQLRTGQNSAHGQQPAGVGLPRTGDWPRAKHNPTVVPQAINTSRVMTETDSSHSPRQGRVQSGATRGRAGDKAAAKVQGASWSYLQLRSGVLLGQPGTRIGTDTHTT